MSTSCRRPHAVHASSRIFVRAILAEDATSAVGWIVIGDVDVSGIGARAYTTRTIATHLIASLHVIAFLGGPRR
jgi:hypothetical protein